MLLFSGNDHNYAYTSRFDDYVSQWELVCGDDSIQGTYMVTCNVRVDGRVWRMFA